MGEFQIEEQMYKFISRLVEEAVASIPELIKMIPDKEKIVYECATVGGHECY
jgi:hypothetical protein